MKDKTKKNIWRTAVVLGIVGGAVHVLQPLNYDPLTLFGTYAIYVQFVAGAATIFALVKSWK